MKTGSWAQRRRLAALLAVVLLGTTGCASYVGGHLGSKRDTRETMAQTIPPAHWCLLNPGDPVRLLGSDLKDYDGVIVAITPDSTLTLRSIDAKGDTTLTTFRCQEIERLSVPHRGSQWERYGRKIGWTIDVTFGVTLLGVLVIPLLL